MTFQIINWSEVSVSLNQGLITAAIATPTSDTSTQQGSQNVFTYFSPTDTVATISASNYFNQASPNSVMWSVQVGDMIFVEGSDYNTILEVATVVLPSNGSSGTITTVAWLNGSLGEFMTVTSLTNAQLLALYTTPIQLIPAQGSGTIIQLIKYEIDYTFATAATADGGLITAQYGNTDHAGGIVCTAGIPAATLNGLTASGQLMDFAAPFGGTNTQVENVGIYLSNATAVFQTGAGTAKVYAWYNVFSPA